MGQYRIQRLNDQLRDEISQLIIRGEVKDPRVSTFLSIIYKSFSSPDHRDPKP